MTSRNGQQLKVLIVLLVILAITLVMGYKMNQSSSASNAPAPGDTAAVSIPADSDARIRIDLIEEPPDEDEVGRSNVFQYRTGRAPQQPGPIPPPAADHFAGAAPPPPSRPMGPPPPPPIPFRYEGYAIQPGGNFTAFLTDNGGHFNVRAGEVLMGRYRIVSITQAVVEVEDLELERQQSLLRVQE